MKQYKKALILGYGRSGKAAERLLQAEGTETIVLTSETVDDTAVSQVLDQHAFDVCVVSPGFGLNHPWLCSVRKAGVSLLSELELGWSRHKGKTIALTGSNGKSSAVKWIHESLTEAGVQSAIGGNYGVPACEVVLDYPNIEWLVLEVSSFQLETVQEFSPDIAVILNVLPNHLDRHETMEVYKATKARIFGQTSGACCIVPIELQEMFEREHVHECTWLTFGNAIEADYRYEKGHVYHAGVSVLELTGTLFDSPVLGSCTGAAVAACVAACGVEWAMAETAARSFEPLPHRLQCLGEINQVVYVDDSKATNLAATSAALQACGKNIRLIAGGLPKESDYTFVKDILAQRVSSIYLLGQASKAMYEAWSEVCRCVECGTLEKAFVAASNDALPEDTVLLSPGCASFDQFSSFGERGECFRKLFENFKRA